MADASPLIELDIVAAEEPVAARGPLAEFWLAYSQSRGALIGLALVLLLIALALAADVVAPHPPNVQYRDFTLTPPVWDAGGSARFLLGTDPVGRDILSRLIHGTRLSLAIGLISVTISLALGLMLGSRRGLFPRPDRDGDHAADGRDARACRRCCSPSPSSRFSGRASPMRCTRSPSCCCRITFA